MTGCHKALAVLPVTRRVFWIVLASGFCESKYSENDEPTTFCLVLLQSILQRATVVALSNMLMHSKAYLQVFRRLLDEPLPSKPADQKIPIWETLGHIRWAEHLWNYDEL